MDGMGWFLFLVIIACVIGLIAVVNRSAHEDEEEETAVHEEKVSWSGPASREPERSREGVKPVIKQNAPAQITLYAYAQSRRLQRCRCCDGENEGNAGFCKVCGMKLR